MLSASEIQGLLVFINVKKSLIHPLVQESPMQYPNWWPSSLSEPYPWWEITHCWPSVLSMSDTFWLTHRAPGGSKNIAFRNTVLLVSWDCCTKSAYTGGFKQQNLLLLQFWRLEAHNRGVDRTGSFWNFQGELALVSLLASGSCWTTGALWSVVTSL